MSKTIYFLKKNKCFFFKVLIFLDFKVFKFKHFTKLHKSWHQWQVAIQWQVHVQLHMYKEILDFDGHEEMLPW